MTKLNCGITLEELKKNRNYPWERFDYLRRNLIKLRKQAGVDADDLGIPSVKKAIGLNASRFMELKSNKLFDYETMCLMAKVINEDVAAIIDGVDGITGLPGSKVVKKRTRRTKAKIEENKVVSSTIGKGSNPIVIVNHCVANVSIIAKPGEIHIYENDSCDTPNNVTCTIFGVNEYVEKGKRKKHEFKGTVKV